MTLIDPPPAPKVPPPMVFDTSFARMCAAEGELAVLAGQVNRALAAMIPVIAPLLVDEGQTWGGGLKGPGGWLAWQLGCDRPIADKLITIARRADELPVTLERFTAGLMSIDQAHVIALRVPAEFEAEAAELAEAMTPGQLRRVCAVKYPALPPDPDEPLGPEPSPNYGFSSSEDGRGNTNLRGKLPQDSAAKFNAAYAAARDELWKEAKQAAPRGGPVPQPTSIEILTRLAERSLDGAAHKRPHARLTRVLMHVDVDHKIGWLHRGPYLTEAVRRLLSCDATWQVVFEKCGVPIGVGPVHEIPDRLRTAVEDRDKTCRVPGCNAKHVQIHHIVHHEDDGVTETWNLVALCPFHHRLHHMGKLSITGNPDDPDGLTITDHWGRRLKRRPPPPEDIPPPPEGQNYQKPSGERLDLNWFTRTPPTGFTKPAPDSKPRLDRDGQPIDWEPTIHLDDDED